MIRAIVNGAGGHMGRILCGLIEKSPDFELAAGVDPNGDGDILKSFGEFCGEADVIIDFSHHTAVIPMLDWAVERKIPAVVATTGHDEAEKAAIKRAAESVPVFHSANTSLGIAFLVETAKKAAAMFPEADIEIVEAHHNRKLDAPSGTALALARACQSARPGSEIVTGRSGMAKREKNEIGVASLRMGNLPGTHAVMITTPTQQITLKHEVYDRALFAEGALTAAKALVNQAPGLYGMEIVV